MSLLEEWVGDECGHLKIGDTVCISSPDQGWLMRVEKFYSSIFLNFATGVAQQEFYAKCRYFDGRGCLAPVRSFLVVERREEGLEFPSTLPPRHYNYEYKPPRKEPEGG